MFPHMRDIKGRKDLVGELGLRTARRAKVRGNLPLVSSKQRRLLYTPSVEYVVG